LLLKSFARLLRLSPGFETDHRIMVDVVLPAQQYRSGEKRLAFFRELSTRLRGATGIKASGAALYFPCRSKLWLATIWRENTVVARGEEPVVYYNLIAGDYFRAMGIPLIEGRLPTERELWESGDVVLINQTMAKDLFPGLDPIDRRIRSGEDGKWMRVIGVVGDVRQKSLDESPKAEYYDAFPQMPMPFMTVVAETSIPDSVALKEIQNTLRGLDPSVTLNNLTSLSAVLGNTVSTQRLAMSLLLLFAALALGLSALGIYGVMDYVVKQRKGELGVRMAIGATPGQVFALVIGEGIRTALIGMAIGLIGAAAFGKFLRSLLYRAEPFDWSIYAGTVALVSLTAVAALYLPAWRAAHVDPVASLHAE
jgi:putative ABC transport system permease protein